MKDKAQHLIKTVLTLQQIYSTNLATRAITALLLVA